MQLTSIRKMIFNGFIFTIPLGILIYVIYRLFIIIHAVILPLASSIGIKMAAGKFVLFFLMIITFLVICLCLGWLLQRATTIKFVGNYLENIVMHLIPSLSYYKSFAQDKFDTKNDQTWQSILLAEGDDWLPAFIVQETDEWVTLFFPEVPQCNTGTIRLVARHNISYKEIPLNEILVCLQTYGGGLSDYLKSDKKLKADSKSLEQ